MFNDVACLIVLAFAIVFMAAAIWIEQTDE